jgi:hypothetical protein
MTNMYVEVEADDPTPGSDNGGPWVAYTIENISHVPEKDTILRFRSRTTGAVEFLFVVTHVEWRHDCTTVEVEGFTSASPATVVRFAEEEIGWDVLRELPKKRPVTGVYDDDDDE